MYWVEKLTPHICVRRCYCADCVYDLRDCLLALRGEVRATTSWERVGEIPIIKAMNGRVLCTSTERRGKFHTYVGGPTCNTLHWITKPEIFRFYQSCVLCLS